MRNDQQIKELKIKFVEDYIKRRIDCDPVFFILSKKSLPFESEFNNFIDWAMSIVRDTIYIEDDASVKRCIDNLIEIIDQYRANYSVSEIEFMFIQCYRMSIN